MDVLRHPDGARIGFEVVLANVANNSPAVSARKGALTCGDRECSVRQIAHEGKRDRYSMIDAVGHLRSDLKRVSQIHPSSIHSSATAN